MNGGLYLVAGATGAIGKQLCRNILRNGGKPLLVGRSQEKLLSLRDELNHPDCRILSGIDFSNPLEAGKKLSAELKGETINGVAYAVGSITLKSLRGCKPDDFVDSYNLNVVGAVELIKASLNGLKKGAKSPEGRMLRHDDDDIDGDTVGSGSSSIVLFSSVAARSGLANHAVIGSNKAAVEGLTVSLASELASSNIRVNCVAPSLTQGSAMASVITDNEAMAAAVAKAHPIARLGIPGDSANAAAFLLSPTQSAWTTGTVLPVDGGRSLLLK